jgi:hypothetical protein
MGDAYLNLCYLYDLSLLKPVTVNHFIQPRFRKWKPTIADIYALVPKIKVTFPVVRYGNKPAWLALYPRCVTHPRRQGAVCGEDCFFGLTPAMDETIKESRRRGAPTQFPPIKFPATDHQLPDKYKVLVPARRTNALPAPEISKILKKEKLPVVVVGTGKHIRHPNVIDLTGKTKRVSEAMGIVAGAAGFVGCQGLFSFVALSQKVPSVVYIRGEVEYLAFRRRLARKWVRFCLDVRDMRGT